jgi:hypothetical protein
MDTSHLSSAAPLCSDSANADMPITVRGYVSDPKQVGYQVLTNYESSYWAPLVGNDAWRLYEVLRSYCHQGNPTCHPSINLLQAILGIKDRSVLIGRAKPKIVKDKSYCYPGLIQILQDHNLMIAEVEHDGPRQRYHFHLNLTPGLLTAEQLAQLPELLQKKHAELLERCAEEQRTLEAKRRPPKPAEQSKRMDEAAPSEPPSVGDGGIGISREGIGNSQSVRDGAIGNSHSIGDGGIGISREGIGNSRSIRDRGIGNSQSVRDGAIGNSHSIGDGGIGISREGIGNSSRGYWNFQYKQQQYNNTHRTTRARDNQNNNNSGASADVVVAFLADHGLSEKVAARLAQQYSPRRIVEKIAFLEFLQAEDPDKVLNPKGWLRRAIEENYAAPDGFLWPEERERRAREAEAAAAEEAARIDALAAQAQALKMRSQEQAAARRQAWRAQYGTTEEDDGFWQLAQLEISFTLPTDCGDPLWRAHILKVKQDVVQIGVESQGEWHQLQYPAAHRAISRALSSVAGRPVELEAVLLKDPLPCIAE